jgi:hypothetical protein
VFHCASRTGQDRVEAAALFRETATWPGTQARLRAALAGGLQQRGDYELNLGAMIAP